MNKAQSNKFSTKNLLIKSNISFESLELHQGCKMRFRSRNRMGIPGFAINVFLVPILNISGGQSSICSRVGHYLLSLTKIK